MKQKIRITESQFEKLEKNLLNEMMSSFSSSKPQGSVQIKKNTNPMEIKKLTDKGLNVSLIDEKLGKEEPITYKHKFDGKKLNIYVTKEKGTIENIMDYVYSIKDTDKVAKAFEGNNVLLFQKEAASGRYKDMGKLNNKYYKNVAGFKNFRKSAPTNGDNTQQVEPEKEIIAGDEGNE